MLRECCALYILSWKCASRHKGVHFFNILTSKSSPTLVCFVGNVLCATTACNFSSLICPDGSAPAALASLLFDPPEPQIIGKNTVSRLFYLFAHLHLLSSDSFSSLIFFLLLFSSLTLPTSAFPSAHIVGSLTSKLPSMIIYHDLCVTIKLWGSVGETLTWIIKALKWDISPKMWFGEIVWHITGINKQQYHIMYDDIWIYLKMGRGP